MGSPQDYSCFVSQFIQAVIHGQIYPGEAVNWLRQHYHLVKEEENWVKETWVDALWVVDAQVSDQTPSPGRDRLSQLLQRLWVNYPLYFFLKVA